MSKKPNKGKQKSHPPQKVGIPWVEIVMALILCAAFAFVNFVLIPGMG